MGKVLSVVNRQINRINVENRAHRLISKEKPTPAPRHPSSLKALREITEDYNLVKEDLMKKDPTLNEYLKNIYVTSHDPPAAKSKFGKPSEATRTPLSKVRAEDPELGYFEPETIPAGRITLKQAMRLLTNHQGDPEKFTASRISTDFTISEQDAGNILKYFGAFKIHMPDEEKERSAEKKIFGYLLPGKKSLPGKTKTEDSVNTV